MSLKVGQSWKAGFTIMELMVALSIVAIVGGGYLIKYASDLYRKHQVENQTKQLYASLIKAKAAAITQSRTLQVTVQKVRLSEFKQGYRIESPTQVFDVIDLGLPVFWNDTELGSVTLTFSFKGTVSPVGSFIVDKDTRDAFYNCIDVSATRISLGRWENAGSTSRCENR